MVYIKINLDTKIKEFNTKDFKLKDSILKIDIIGSKEKIKALNYDKILGKFKGAYKLSINFSFTDSEGVTTKVVNASSIIDFFDSYAEKKGLEDNVVNFCRKVIDSEFKAA
jgi:hypothetical protein